MDITADTHIAMLMNIYRMERDGKNCTCLTNVVTRAILDEKAKRENKKENVNGLPNVSRTV